MPPTPIDITSWGGLFGPAIWVCPCRSLFPGDDLFHTGRRQRGCYQMGWVMEACLAPPISHRRAYLLLVTSAPTSSQPHQQMGSPHVNNECRMIALPFHVLMMAEREEKWKHMRMEDLYVKWYFWYFFHTFLFLEQENELSQEPHTCIALPQRGLSGTIYFSLYFRNEEGPGDGTVGSAHILTVCKEPSSNSQSSLAGRKPHKKWSSVAELSLPSLSVSFGAIKLCK